MSPRRLYRALALAEVVTWTLLIVGMLLKYVTHTTDLGVRLGGGIHGLVFLAYCLGTVLVGVDGRWGAGRTLLGLGSAVVPYATVPFERSAERRGGLSDRWRLRDQPPAGAIESLVALVLRHPVLSAVLGLLLVGGLFAVLLSLGPPTEWGR